MWKLIEGYYWPYRINEKAEIEREVRPGEWRRLSTFHCPTSKQLRVHMKCADGKRRNVLVKGLMVKYFLGGPQEGKVVAFRNGMVCDCEKENLYFTTRHEVAKRYGGNLRKSVEKVDQDGNVIAIYRSVTEAAEKNFISRKSVWLRCANKLRDPYLLDGTTYRYEE